MSLQISEIQTESISDTQEHSRTDSSTPCMKDLWRAHLLKYLVRGFHRLDNLDSCNLDFVVLA